MTKLVEILSLVKEANEATTVKCSVCGKPLTQERYLHELGIFEQLQQLKPQEDPETPFAPACSEECEIKQFSSWMMDAQDQGLLPDTQTLKRDFKEWAREHGIPDPDLPEN